MLLLLSVVGGIVVSSVDELAEQTSPKEFAGDILLSSSQLHRPSLPNDNRINPLLNALRSSFSHRSFAHTLNNGNGNGNGVEEDERYQRLYPHFRRQRYSYEEDEEEDDALLDGDESAEDEAEADPVVVRLHIQPKEEKEEKEEELETKFVRLFIGTWPKRS